MDPHGNSMRDSKEKLWGVAVASETDDQINVEKPTRCSSTYRLVVHQIMEYCRVKASV
jgi:hypothetical protein